jgi:predicted metal-dependent hydrolase
MQRSITYESSTIRYALRRSARARRMRLAVHRDGSVTLTLPTRVSLGAGEAFVQRLGSWVLSRIASFGRTPVHPASLYGRAEYLSHREAARLLVASRLAVFAPVLGVSYGRVSIRSQRTCWGSCSRSGNLNFNYKVLFLPPHLQDYVIVHELAHRLELSHSARFWAVVTGVLPDFRLLRRELRGMGMI